MYSAFYLMQLRGYTYLRINSRRVAYLLPLQVGGFESNLKQQFNHTLSQSYPQKKFQPNLLSFL